MSKKSFLLVSLQEDKAKKLAQVVSNASCRKILDYLADNESATETDLSKLLHLPLSTVHYNIQHLQKAGLVEAEEFHYSEKGKEVNHYKLANKYIIIAPKSTHGIKEKLKSILPAGLIALGGAFILGFWNKVVGTSSFATQTTIRTVQEAAQSAPLDTVAEQAAPAFADSAAEIAAPAAEKAVEKAVETVPTVTEPIKEQIITTVSEPSLWQNIGLWFFIGAFAGLIIYLLISLLRKE